MSKVLSIVSTWHLPLVTTEGYFPHLPFCHQKKTKPSDYFILLCGIWYIPFNHVRTSLIERYKWGLYLHRASASCAYDGKTSSDKCVKALTWKNSFQLSLNSEGCWGTTDKCTTSLLCFSLFSTALWDLVNSRPVHSLMLSSEELKSLILCLDQGTEPCWHLSLVYTELCWIHWPCLSMADTVECSVKDHP